MLGVDVLAAHVHLLLVKLGEVEEMASLELIVPHLSCAGLIRWQGFFALGGDFVVMVLIYQKKEDK